MDNVGTVHRLYGAQDLVNKILFMGFFRKRLLAGMGKDELHNDRH